MFTGGCDACQGLALIILRGACAPDYVAPELSPQLVHNLLYHGVGLSILEVAHAGTRVSSRIIHVGIAVGCFLLQFLSPRLPIEASG